MKKINSLIETFKLFQQELNKNTNQSYSSQANVAGSTPTMPGTFKSGDAITEKIEFAKNGQWSLDKVDPQEHINIPHPKNKAKMAIGVNKAEGTNVEASPSRPHNKGKFLEMDEATEQESKKANVKGQPYNGEEKENSHGRAAIVVKKNPIEATAKVDEQRDQNKGRTATFGM